MGSFIEGGGPDCYKCGSWKVYSDTCSDCKTNQTEWLRNNILENIKQFGFKKSFFTRKWKYQDIVLESIPNTTNMKFKLNGEYILLNYYGRFEDFKKNLERKLGKRNIRSMKLKNFLNEN